MGHKRVFNLVKTRFYWPNHIKDIHDFVTKKCSCLKDKRPNQEKRAPLVIIVTQEPLEHILIDYLHLSKSKGRYEHLLIVVDHFNKYVQAFPTINKSGRAATDLLFNNQVGQQLISYSTNTSWTSFPKHVIHDKGKESENKLFKHIEQLVGIKSSKTTPHRPMGNGISERMNRSVINMLKTLTENHNFHWKDYIKK